jgi:hypothetical protein
MDARAIRRGGVVAATLAVMLPALAGRPGARGADLLQPLIQRGSRHIGQRRGPRGNLRSPVTRKPWRA